MIKKIIIACLLGIFCSLIILQNDPWVHAIVKKEFQALFATLGNCRVTGTVESVNLFIPRLELSDMRVTPCAGHAWHWHAKKFRLQCSWLHFICFGSLDLHVEIDDMEADSQINQRSLAIMEHLHPLMFSSAPDIVAFLKSLQIRRGVALLHDDATDLKIAAQWHSDSKKIDQTFKTHLYLLDGSVRRQEMVYMHGWQGSLSVNSSPSFNGYDIFCNGSSSLNIPQLQGEKGKCTISGFWDRNHGSCSFGNADGTLRADPVTLMLNDGRLTVDVRSIAPIDYIWHLVYGHEPDVPLTGVATMQANCTMGNSIEQARGSLSIDEMIYGRMPMCSGTVSFCKQADAWQGSVQCRNGKALSLEGAWKFHELLQRGSVDFYNSSCMQVPYSASWLIHPRDAHGVVDYDRAHSRIECSYTCTAQHKNLETDRVTLQAKAWLQDDAFSLNGLVADIDFQVAGLVRPRIEITTGLCRDKQGNLLFSLQKQADDLLHGFVQVPFLQTLVHSLSGYQMQGEGRIELKSTFGDTIKTTMHLANGSLRLPYTYNVMNGFDACLTIDPYRQKVIIEDVQCTMYRGSLHCKRGLIQYNNAAEISFAHIPLLLNHCFLNFSKDLFTVISGRILVSKKEDEAPMLKSALIIESARLKENILSNVVQKNLLQLAGGIIDIHDFDLACDISLETRAPMYVKTAFLETTARMNLTLRNSLRSPEIAGSLTLNAGSMMFPYKPLNISKGTIYFMPQQKIDPMVELVAKNKIKKYNVSMTVAGSMSNPHIILESSPPLTEEQIIALLLVGSPEASLNFVMPTLVMQNLTSLVFGKNQTLANLDHYFKSWLRPFKSVHLVPSFTDQSGRGGLRGALEIEVNDRWKALIQKNFNLSEDTRFEVEYSVSDDMSVRAIRDERRDLGGEVEMRWKF